MTDTATMLRVFGWAVWSPEGRLGSDEVRRARNVAGYSEQRDGRRNTPNGFPLWDRDAAHLDCIQRFSGDSPQTVHLWWALPWVVEDLARLSKAVYDDLEAVADA